MRLFWLALLLLASCGGGGSSTPANSTQAIEPAVTLDHPGQVVVFQQSGKHQGVQTLSLQVDPGDFFKCVGNGHAGVMVHADLASITTGQHRGAVYAFGLFDNTTYTTRNAPKLQPTAIVETMAVGAVPEPFDSILAYLPITPGVTLTTPPGHIVINGLDLADPNPVTDTSETAVVFFVVGDEPRCPYEIRIFNPVVTWSPT